MTYLPPGNQDPYGQQPQPPQDPFSGQPSNPYAQQSPAPPPPASAPPTPPYGQPYAYGAPVTPPQNSMALTSMILSLVGLATWITAPIGAILGHVALKQIRETGESGEGMAKTGIIVGWIITGLGVLCCVGAVLLQIGLFAAATSSSGY
jgi:hypothetical protein